jgi:Holliday junction DNA helicase RuvA
MINKLYGYVEEIIGDQITVMVGGIGYAVQVGNSTIGKIMELKPRQEMMFFINSISKEDGTILFGFLSMVEKIWFNELIKLNGISGKIAINILGHVSTQQLDIAIQSGDEAMFTQISGIGKKLAARIVNEMKESFAKVSTIMLGYQPMIDKKLTIQSVSEANTAAIGNDNVINEAMMALQALGFSRSDSYSVVLKISQSNNNISSSQLIKEALQAMQRG